MPDTIAIIADEEGAFNIADSSESSKPEKELIEEEEKNISDAVSNDINNSNDNPNANITVAVTGASGFIGAHCIKQLLEKGYKVRGTVRGDPSADKYKWIYDISTKFNIPNKVTLYQADLLQNGSFNECFKDCDYIFHVASPFFINAEDPMRDLVEPAKNGTLNALNCALNACSNSDRLKRIVITSSIAAINGNTDPNKVCYPGFICIPGN